MSRQILESAGLQCHVCSVMPGLCAVLEEGAGALLLTDEALSSQALACLTHALDAQESWSDIPLIVFPANSDNTGVLLEKLGTRANVMILDRPVRIEILVNAARSAL